MRPLLLLSLVSLLSLTACRQERTRATADPAAAACPSCACGPSVSAVLPVDFGAAVNEGEVQAVVGVAVDASGTVTVNAIKAPLDADVRRLVVESLAKSASPRFVFMATDAIPYGKVVHVLDVIKGAGARKVTLGFVGGPIAGTPEEPLHP